MQAAQAALSGEAAAGVECEHRGQELRKPRAANVVKGLESHLQAARAAVVVYVHDGHEHADGGEELRGLILGERVEFDEHRRGPDSAREAVALEFQALHALRQQEALDEDAAADGLAGGEEVCARVRRVGEGAQGVVVAEVGAAGERDERHAENASARVLLAVFGAV